MAAIARQLLALLQACKDDPTSDQPRRILADWLEEYDDGDRAVLLRRQYGQAVPEDAPTEIELLRRHGKRWLGSFAESPGTWEIRRG